jgi:hypothetical protein
MTWATGAPGTLRRAHPETRNLPHRTFCGQRSRRWFVATDVDSDFTWVGGSQGLTDAVITDPKLDAERVHGN